LPEEFDELSPKEELYYQKPPFSTNEVFLGSKGGVSQLVDHGPEGVRQGYAKYEKVKNPYGQSAKAKFRNFLKTLSEDVIKDNTVLDLIKRSEIDISQTNALNVFAEDFKDIKPLRELPKPDKIEVEKLLKGKTGRMESITYKGEEWYKGSDGRIRIKREPTLGEKIIKSKKATLAREKIISEFGAFPTGTRDPAKRLWHDLYDSYLKTKIRDPKDSRTITKSRLQLANYKNIRNWTADIAYNKLKFYDTVTKQTFGFKDLETFMEKHIGKDSYKKLLEPYKQKIFLNTTYGNVKGKAISLRYALNETLVPGWSVTNRLQNTFEIHHPFGKAKNPFLAHLAFFDANAKEYRLKSNLFKKLANPPEGMTKKQIVKNFINDVPEGILTAPGKKVYGKQTTFEDLLKQAKKRSVVAGDVRVKTILESPDFLKDLQKFCGYAGGGRVSLKAGSCPTDVAARNFARASEDLVQGRVTGKAGKELAEKIGRVSGKAPKSLLTKLLGPYGIGIDVVFEAGSIGTDVLQGKPLNEAIADNWIIGTPYKKFTGKTGQKLFNERLAKLDSSTKLYGDTMNLAADIEDLDKKLERQKLELGKARSQINKAAITETEAEIEKKTKEFNTLTKDGTLIEPGTVAYESYHSAATELRDARRAKSKWSKLGAFDETVMMEAGAKRLGKTYGVGEEYDVDPTKMTLYDKRKLEEAQAKPVSKTPISSDEMQYMTEYLRDQGVLDRRGEMPSWIEDKLQHQRKWQMEFEQPGIRGTQDWRGARGGIANLTRTVAPDSGPVSRGLRSLYIDDMD